MDDEKKQGMTILFMYVSIGITLIVAVVSSFVAVFNIIDYFLASWEESFNWYWRHKHMFDTLANAVSFLLVSYGVLFYVSRKVRLLTDNRFYTSVFYRICHAVVLFIIILSLLAVSVSLATLLSGFLGGDISIGYAFKSLFVAGIGGVVFFYYRGVLHGMWRTHRKEEKVLVGTCTLLVLLIIVTSVSILNPFERRSVNETFETLESMKAFTEDVDGYYKRTGSVPSDINSSEFLDNEGVYREYEWEKEVGERFTYERLSDTVYNLCASFNAVPPERFRNSSGYPYERFKIQGKGEQCFTITANGGESGGK